jgi:hypothetical protein
MMINGTPTATAKNNLTVGPTFSKQVLGSFSVYASVKSFLLVAIRGYNINI